MPYLLWETTFLFFLVKSFLLQNKDKIWLLQNMIACPILYNFANQCHVDLLSRATAKQIENKTSSDKKYNNTIVVLP